MPKDKANYTQIAQNIFLTDLAAELQKELGQTPPTTTERTERLKYDTFDPKNPSAYIDKQIKQFQV